MEKCVFLKTMKFNKHVFEITHFQDWEIPTPKQNILKQATTKCGDAKTIPNTN